jgi:hypothetical protein
MVGYFHMYRDGVDTVFIDHPCFHAAVDNIYGGDRRQQNFRNAMLCQAAIEAVWHVPCGGQGLTLLHFSPQPEPFLTQNTPCTPTNTPYTTLHTLCTTPACTPYPTESAYVEPKSRRV